MSRRLAARFALALCALLWAACDGSPAAPRTFVLKLPNFNTPPVIRSVTAATSAVARTEAGQDIAVTAVVEDNETPISKLTFLWSANVGTVTGGGPNVTWRLAPGATQTPVDVTLTLVVVEAYDDVDAHGNPVPKENRVTQSAAPFRVHDSVAELTKMSLDFLVVYFGHSDVSATDAVVDFSNSCPGKCDEWTDVANNRINFLILSASAFVQSVVFNDADHATVLAPTSIINVVVASQQTQPSNFTDQLTAVFENGRWWLCSSTVPNPQPLSMNEFLRRSIRGGLAHPLTSVDRSACPFLTAAPVR